MSAPRADPLQFEDFVLDVARHSLRRRGTPIVLQPKTFALLAYFCANPGRLIRKDELLRELWPGVIVTDNSLTRCIKDLRKALGDDVQVTRFIETVPRLGYRFLVEPRPLEASEAEASPAHVHHAAADQPASRRRSRHAIGLAIAALVIVLAAVAWQLGRDGAGSRTAAESATPVVTRAASGAGAGAVDLDAEMNFRLGLDVLERRRHNWRVEALAAFERALERDPAHAGAHAGKALALAAGARSGAEMTAQLSDADAAAERALEIDPESGFAQAAKGLILLRRGAYAEAEQTLGRAVAREPAFGAARSWLISALHHQGRYAESLAHFEQALALDPLNPRLLDGFGVALEMRGDLEGAERMYQRMLSLKDPPPGARIRLTDLALSRGRLVDALGHAEALQDFAETRHPAASLITPALVYARLGACAEAQARTRAALSGPLDAGWRGQLERVHRTLGWFDRLEALAGADAAAPETRLFLGRVAVLRGDDALGIQRLEEAFATPFPTDPGDPTIGDSRLLLAFALLQDRRPAEARAHLEPLQAAHAARVVAGVAATPGAHYHDAMTLHLTGRNDEAVAALDRAVALGWNDVFTAWYDRRWQGLRQHPGFRRVIESSCAQIAVERTRLAASRPLTSALACPPPEHRASCTP